MANKHKQYMLGVKPFKGCRIAGPYFDKAMARHKMLIIDDTARTRKAMLVSRVLMCVYLGKMLDAHVTVDHIDGNAQNDNIANLQVLSVRDNARKGNGTQASRMVRLICPICQSVIIDRLSRCPRGSLYSCSRRCSTRLLRQNPKTSKSYKSLAERQHASRYEYTRKFEIDVSGNSVIVDIPKRLSKLIAFIERR